MRDQIIEITGRFPMFRQPAAPSVKEPSYPDAAFWMRVFSPLTDASSQQQPYRALCPWSMAAQLDDTDIPASRRRDIMDALKKGLRTMRQFELPSYRIRFMEHSITHEISVWVD